METNFEPEKVAEGLGAMSWTFEMVYRALYSYEKWQKFLVAMLYYSEKSIFR